LTPDMFEHALGRIATRDLQAGEVLKLGDFGP
jgi:hypothetical protein